MNPPARRPARATVRRRWLSGSVPVVVVAKGRGGHARCGSLQQTFRPCRRPRISTRARSPPTSHASVARYSYSHNAVMSAEALARQQIAAGTRRVSGQGGPKRLPGPEGEKYVRTSRCISRAVRSPCALADVVVRLCSAWARCSVRGPSARCSKRRKRAPLRWLR